MPEMDGLELLERAKQQFPALDVIVLTSVSTAEPAVRALRGGRGKERAGSRVGV